MIVLDASAAIKLLVTEEYSDRANRIFNYYTAKGEPLLAPTLIFSEVMNGLWKHNVLLKDLPNKKLEIAKLNLVKVYNNLVLSDPLELADYAILIAMTHKTSFYDSLYIALSLNSDSALFTFDRQVLKKAKDIGLKIIDTNSPSYR